MKKGIYLRFIILSFITIALSGTISAIFFAAKEKTLIKEYTIQICQVIANHYQKQTQASYLSQELKGLRVTLFSPNGTVLDDSHMNPKKMQNHFNRYEVQHAQRGYVVSDIRTSETLRNGYIYTATKLEDGNILRIGSKYRGIWAGFFAQLPIFSLTFFITVIVSAFVAHSFARKVTHPLEIFIEQMRNGNYNTVSSEKGFYEIDKIKSRMQEFLDEIKNALKATQLQSDKIHYILSNIKEGLILLDQEKNIVMINKRALKIFHTKKTFGNLLELTRNPQLIKSVDEAIFKENHSQIELEVAEVVFSAYISPVKGAYIDSKQNGATVLLVAAGLEQLAQSERSKFFTNASHELKTPITTLMGLSEMLQNGTLIEEKKEQIYQRIHRETKRMNSLIEDILTISRLESRVTEDILERINIHPIIQDVIETEQPRAQENQIELTYKGEDVFIVANSRRMRDLLSNLVDNAIKYNKPNGRVKVELSLSKNHVLILVKDTGIGISRADQYRVFERFYRAESAPAKLIKGTGLGLSIVKHIVNSYGGHIRLQSTLGMGTEIWVTLPKAGTK